MNLRKSLSTSLVRKILIYGLPAAVAVKKALLTKKQQLARKRWAAQEILKPLGFWKNVIYSDKSTLELFPNHREYVRHPRNSHFEEKYLTKTTTFGGKK